MKILDRYIVKTFLGPFIFIFSILFFILMVNVIWTQMGNIFGKGLTYWELGKVLFYMSATVVPLCLPLTILLGALMMFGNLGERYELAAMKAAGIPLVRVLKPLFITVLFLSGILFLFQNNIAPSFQRKAQNMLMNIRISRPALNFTAGQFVNEIPNYTVKFDKIYGENEDIIEGVFVHKVTNTYGEQQSIIAKKGIFRQAEENKNFLKLKLYNGYIYEDDYKNLDYQSRFRQPNQVIKFDTLTYYLDISAIIQKNIEEENISDHYKFQTYGEINKTIDRRKQENSDILEVTNMAMVNSTGAYAGGINDETMKKKAEAQYDLKKVKKEDRLEALYKAHSRIENLKSEKRAKDEQIFGIIKDMNSIVMHQQKILAFSFTCIIFFLIGSSLGSIIRKGGMGLPIVIAIVVFIIFFVINLTAENFSWKGQLDPYIAAWLPNMILLPFGIWLTSKAINDSQVFDIEKYKSLLKPITKLFIKNKEHSRYQ